MLSRAGLNRLTPRAGWLMVIALNVPDIDILWTLGGQSYLYLDQHRGWTHSAFYAPVMALLPLTLTRQFHFRAWVAATLGVLTHILQDYTNVYGIRSLWPVSHVFYRLDWVSVVDPWIWLILLTGVAWPALAAMVSSEIGERITRGPAFALAILAAMLTYVGAHGVLHASAIDLLSSRSYPGGGGLRQVAAFPTAMNPLEWTGIANLEREWRVIPIDLDREFNPEAGRRFPKQPPSPVASATAPFRAFLSFAQFPVWVHIASPDGGGTEEVQVCDLRFGLPGEGRFCAIAEIGVRGNVRASSFQFGPPRLR
jgi:inner membrane protein